jgi:hypothetical protein
MELVVNELRGARRPPVARPSPAPGANPALARAVLVGCLACFALAHAPFLPVEFFSDEGDNLLGGWLLSRGRVPYRDFFSQHTPFGYFFSALVTLGFGRNWVVQRYAVALFGLACLAYLLRRLIRGPDRTLFYAAALLTLLWPVYSVLYWGYMLLNDNLAAYPYLLCFGLIANAVWNRVPLSRADGAVLGLAAAVAVLSNPFMVFPALALVPAFAFALYTARPREGWGRCLIAALVGGGVPLALTVGYLLATRSLGHAWAWVITFNRTVYPLYGGCPPRLGPMLQHQLRTLLDLFGDIHWDFRPHFGAPLATGMDYEDRWVYFGLAGRAAVLALCGYWLVTRRVVLAVSLFGFAVASLLRGGLGVHAQPFRLLELFAELLLLVPCLRALRRAAPARRVLALAPAAALVGLQVLVASRAVASLRQLHQAHPIRLTLHPRGTPMSAGGEHLRNVMAGAGQLLAFPVHYQLNYTSGYEPASFFQACVPWTFHRPEDRERLLDDVRRAARANTVIVLSHGYDIWHHPFADYARALIAAVEQDYIEIQPGIYVSPSNPNSWQPPLHKQPLPPVPSEFQAMTWAGGVGQGTAEHPRVVFSLGRPEFVYRIQVRFVLTTAAGTPPRFRAWWRQRGATDFEGVGRRCCERLLLSGPPERVLSLPVGETIDQFRIEPDAGPCRFEVRAITVVTEPAAGQPAS